MTTTECSHRRQEAAEEFDQREARNDGAAVVDSLCDGLSLLRGLLYRRVHHDVERAFGMDSMLAPVAASRTEELVKAEIEVYQIAVSARTATERNYVRTGGDWYPRWLARLRLGESYASTHFGRQLERHLEMTAEKSRRHFERTLGEALREALKAPLVLYRLFPLAVDVATSTAFGDPLAASEARNQQIAVLPPIEDCQQCQGRPLPSDERCHACGNPLWNYEWLTATD